MNQISIQKYRPFRYCDYLNGSNLVGSEYYPELQPTNIIPDKVIGFNEKNSVKDLSNYYLDHFIDDYHFESVWGNCDKYLEKYRQFKGVITTDFSVYRDMPLWVRKYNVGRNRTIAYHLQKNGINVIPVASWAYLEDFDWCLDGLPKESSVAISTNGCMSNFISKNVFLDGVDELQRILHPSNLIIAGGPLPELDKKCDNIRYYKNFSQRLNERRRHGK